MSYQSAIQYLNSCINYEKKSGFKYKESFKLERMRHFMSLVGNPQESLRCIHVSGTKGKGSSCVYAAYILREAGYKTGLYTSPHLWDIRERVRIFYPRVLRYRPAAENFEGMIPRADMAAYIQRLKPLIEKLNARLLYEPLTFFEIYTALALLYFKEQSVDFAVLETGLGGRLDATNIVSARVCGITPVSFDHMDKLGATLRLIAREKAGIIKHHACVISAAQTPDVMDVIKKKCAITRSRLYVEQKDITSKILCHSGGYQEFSVSGKMGKFARLRTRLLGRHQVSNASVGIGLAVQAAALCGKKLAYEEISKGVYNTLWPVRFDIVCRKPLIVVDGAHNADSAKALRQTLRDYFPRRRILFVIGMSNDKDIRGFCRELSVCGGDFIISRARNPRAADPELISLIVRACNAGGDIIIKRSISAALNTAKTRADSSSIIVVTGSLFLVAEAKKYLLAHSS
ncbi:MAG: bifunctional folylpolyglutamate synthase/dihydrofolate synthase [Candidatus Omnitrophica bacterium]|nr:bifunctional folylpolyglutamate synthase/dihydrofolate synthase [Candidatus Omnitrophota bacterium]